MTKKPKTVRVGNTEIKVVTPNEHKQLERRIKERHEKLRNRYSEIHGKIVDWVSHEVNQDSLYVNIRFKDKTDFSLRFSSRIDTDYIELSDEKAGDFRLIREYYKRKDL
jgi:hypothetical protein